MTLTKRGQRLLVAIAFLFGIGIVFLDVFILAAFLVALILFTYDWVDARRISQRGGSSVVLTPDSFHASLVRGDPVAFKANVSTGRQAILDIPETPWIGLEPSNFEPGSWPVALAGSPESVGRYSADHVTTRVTSRYGLFVTSVETKLSLDVRVYPRFLIAALAVAELLVRAGGGLGGENVTELIGPGLEYAETRPYVPGDSLRRIDWKATARFSSLMIKQFYRESGGALNIEYQLETPGPRTHDEMATQFLNLVLAATSGGVPVRVTAYDGGKLTARFAGRSSGVLASALSLVLDRSGISIDEVYSLLDVVPVSQERRAILLSGRRRLADLIERARRVEAQQDWASKNPLAEFFAEGTSQSFVILSSLASRNPLLTEMVDDLAARGCAITVCYPPKPWSDARDLEEAYLISISQKKLLKFAESRGCEMLPMSSRTSRLTVSSQIPAQVVTPSV